MTYFRFFKKAISVGGDASDASFSYRFLNENTVPIMEEISVDQALLMGNHDFVLRGPTELPIRAIIFIQIFTSRHKERLVVAGSRYFSLEQGARVLRIRIGDLGGVIAGGSKISILYVV